MTVISSACTMTGAHLEMEDEADIMSLLLDPEPIDKSEAIPTFLSMAVRIGNHSCDKLKLQIEELEAENRKAISFIRGHGLLEEFRDGKKKKSKSEPLPSDLALKTKEEPPQEPEPAKELAEELPASESEEESAKELLPEPPAAIELDSSDIPVATSLPQTELNKDMFGGPISAADFLSKQGHSFFTSKCLVTMKSSARSYALIEPGAKIFEYEVPLQRVLVGGGIETVATFEGKVYLTARNKPEERYAVCGDCFIEINDKEPVPDTEDDIV